MGAKMTVVYEVMVYPQKWDDDQEKIISEEEAESSGKFETEAEAVKRLLQCNESAYIWKHDDDSNLELWDDMWYFEDVIRNKNHPWDIP